MSKRGTPLSNAQIICNNFKTVRDGMVWYGMVYINLYSAIVANVSNALGYKLVLISNRKSHMGFRLIPKSVTLNDLERRHDRYLGFFRRIWYFYGPITSKWSKIDLYLSLIHI